MRSEIFDDLFVLELANNHWGRVERGLRIIREFGQVVRYRGVKAAMKLQFRDVDRFIHKDYRDRTDIRYIKKTIDTQLPWEHHKQMLDAVHEWGMIKMVTPFDEVSVQKCVEFGVQIFKIASSDIKDWPLIEQIAKTGRPVIMSTGGSSLRDIDDMVEFFNKRGIPFSVNHCVSLYPSEDAELELNQIDFLIKRYPDNVIGFSTHEYHSWDMSVAMAYAKGARTFERHVDIEADGIPVSSYCTLPEQADKWFKSFKLAQEMCGPPGTAKRIPPEREVRYLDALVRGVYAKEDLKAGDVLNSSNVYLAVPLLKGQISCRELMNGEVMVHDAAADQPIQFNSIESPYSKSSALAELIADRGLDPKVSA
jgi:N-acetylneuraminate synthase